MEEFFSYQFQSTSIAVFTFIGLTLVGFGLGLMFWIDFRRRFIDRGQIAGLVVIIVGTLLGMYFGYLTTQPGYFKNLKANTDGIWLDYHWFAAPVFLGWNEIERIEIQRDRLLVISKSADSYKSPVVYRDNQTQLLQSVTSWMPREGK
jgi:hypothetical protein